MAFLIILDTLAQSRSGDKPYGCAVCGRKLGECSVHSKKKQAAGHMDQLLRKAAGPQQKSPIHTLN